MKNRICACLLTGLLLVQGVPARAAQSGFPDVGTDHWAAGYITELAAGGLVHGFDDGRFGPEELLRVDQLATVIANARGLMPTETADYWALPALEYCSYGLGCLPDLGELTRERYSALCSRELAYHMLIRGLGAAPDAPAEPLAEEPSIPDLEQVDPLCRDSVAEAYALGLCNGVDQTGRFDPKAPMTRAQMAAMLVRAGWTREGSAAPVTTGERSCQAIYEAVRAREGWEELMLTPGLQLLTCQTPGVGGLYVGLETDRWGQHRLKLRLDQEGEPSAYGYKGRRELLELVQLCFPERWEQVWTGIREAFLGQRWDSPAYYLPNSLSWAEERVLAAGYAAGDSRCFILTVGEQGDSLLYRHLSYGEGLQLPYDFGNLTWEQAEELYELDRWPEEA